MKTPAVILTLSAVIALPCYSQTTVPADLRAAMTERAAALQKADATTWARFTADNFVVVTGAGIVQTKAERVAQIKAGQPNGPSTSENETVHVYGHNALQRFESTRDGIWVTFGLILALYVALGATLIITLLAMSRRWRSADEEDEGVPYGPAPGPPPDLATEAPR